MLQRRQPTERTCTDGATDFVGEQLHGVDAEELAGGDEHAALGVGERVRGFVALPPRADRGDDTTRAPHRRGGDHPLPPVRGPDGDTVTGVEPERDETGGDLALSRVQVGEGEVHVAVDDRVGLRVQVRRGLEHHRQCRPRNRIQFDVGHGLDDVPAAVVRSMPRWWPRWSTTVPDPAAGAPSSTPTVRISTRTGTIDSTASRIRPAHILSSTSVGRSRATTTTTRSRVPSRETSRCQWATPSIPASAARSMAGSDNQRPRAST